MAKSGTATAIASHARSGERAKPSGHLFPNRTDKIAPWWAGQVHAFLIDAQGNLREDTNANQRLDPTSDRIIEFGEDLIHAHVDANGDGAIDAEERNATALGNIGDIEFLWSSSTWLNSLTDQQVVTQRGRYASVAPNRYIMTLHGQESGHDRGCRRRRNPALRTPRHAFGKSSQFSGIFP